MRRFRGALISFRPMGDEERDTEQGKDDEERRDDDAEQDDGEDREESDGDGDDSSDEDDSESSDDDESDEDDDSDSSDDDDDEDEDEDESDPEREQAIRHGKDAASRRADGLDEVEEEEEEDEDDDDRSGKDDDSRKQREDDEPRQRKDDDDDEDEDDEKGGRGRKLKLLVAALVGALIIVVIAVVISSGGEEKEKPPTTTTQREGVEGPIIGAGAVNKRYAGIPQDGLELGERKANVTIVEFADLQCPFCRQASETSLPPLVERYVKPGKLRMEFRNFAILGPDSEKAAKALEAAAAQDKAWQFIELFYLNQGEENSGYVTDDFIRRIGKAIPGMDVEQLVVASNAEGGGQSIEAAQKDAEEFGIDSTPSYLIGRTGGQLAQLQLTDPSDVNQYTEAVDRLLIEQDVEGAGD